MGIPHGSVKGLPAGTHQSNNGKGTPMGLNNDPKKTFSVIRENDENILKITGEIFGGINTIKSYSNYHLQMKMKWGEKKWEPRLNKKRDSGILYHCHGNHGSFWKVWKSSLEFQVQEKDMGDFIPLAGPTAMAWAPPKEGKPQTPVFKKATSYTHCIQEPDFPNGEWNSFDIYVIGDSAIHVVNGVVVMILRGAVDGKGTPLIQGQIQIQSEAAECYYKDIRIRSIKSYPKKLLKVARP